MKKTNCLLTLSVAALCAAGRAYAVGTAPAILSNYGEIQSVKNYSSNPFWNKNSPYNQNFPKPIYATGADLNTGDCNRVVENLVAAYCAEHNYCRNLRISDVRPTIMVQLSQLPGHNFATSCGGYIDSTFDKFQKEYGNTSTVNLPNATTQNTNIQITNPFTPKQTAEQRAVADRTAELERLQSITTPAAGVRAEYFPKTTADISFTDRLANTAAGYEPYKDKESYKKPNFLGEDEAFFERLKAQNFEEYCNRRPDDPGCLAEYCKKHPTNPKCKEKDQNDPDPDPTPDPGPNSGPVVNVTCQSSMPEGTPDCLLKLTNIISLNENETINDVAKDSARLVKIGNTILESCIKPGITGHTLSAFNQWLYKHDSIPITIGTQTCLFNAETIFNYVGFPTSVLFSKQTNLKPGDTVQTFNGGYVTTDKCSDQAIGGHSDHKTTVHLAASAVNFPHNCENGITYFVDYPVGKANRVFPGLLLESCASFFGQEHLIRILNYKTALTLVRTFVDNVNNTQYDKHCANQGLNVYLVKQPDVEYTRVRHGNKVDTLTIVTDPYNIP